MPRVTLLLLVFRVCLFAQTVSLPPKADGLPLGAASLSGMSEKVVLWYPAKASGARQPYVSQDLITELLSSGYYDQSSDTIRAWGTLLTHATLNAPPQMGPVPLVIFLPGQGVLAFQYTIIAEDLAGRGYAVAVVDYFSSTAPKRVFADDDVDAATDDMARAAVEVANAIQADKRWSRTIRTNQIVVGGHSIGGAAALEVPRRDHRFIAAIDLDGAPFGKASMGATVPTLVLRSKPLYSDSDLAKRGLSKADFEKRGADAAKVLHDFLGRSTAQVNIYSILGTGHMSFSDSPFTMPDAISRFGGKIIDRERNRDIVDTCLTEFITQKLKNPQGAHRCTSFPEVVKQ